MGFANGVLTVFFDVAYQSYLPSLVDRDQIVDGNSKLEISRSAAQIGGPGISGVVIGILTAPVAIILASASSLVSALAVFGIRKPEPAPDRHVDEHGRRRGSMRQEVTEGLRYVLGHRYLRSIAASTGWSNLFSSLLFIALIPYMVRGLGLSPEVVGFVLGLGNIGTLVGALTAMRIGRVLGVGRTIIASMFLFGPGALLIAIAPREAAAPFLVAGMFLFGISGMVYNINQVSFRQAITPTRIQGRMNATMRFIVWGTIPVGTIGGGALGSAVGLSTTIWIGAIGGFLAFLPLLVGAPRGLREMPEPVEGGPVNATREPTGGPFVGRERHAGGLRRVSVRGHRGGRRPSSPAWAARVGRVVQPAPGAPRVTFV